MSRGPTVPSDKGKPRGRDPGFSRQYSVGCEGRIRTADLRVMSPMSYRCSTSPKDYTKSVRTIWRNSTLPSVSVVPYAALTSPIAAATNGAHRLLVAATNGRPAQPQTRRWARTEVTNTCSTHKTRLTAVSGATWRWSSPVPPRSPPSRCPRRRRRGFGPRQGRMARLGGRQGQKAMPRRMRGALGRPPRARPTTSSAGRPPPDRRRHHHPSRRAGRRRQRQRRRA